MDGIISIIKPPGMTSHDVVGYIRKHFKEKKVGHTGTLDPNAAGVLPICIGKATKVVDYIMEDYKKYRAELTFGTSTDTQDAYGKVIGQSDKIPSIEEIEKVIKSFLGDYWQEPPMYSAIKIDGKKLYELARQGKEVERKKRLIQIFELDIISYTDSQLIFDVTCSKGTYVRTLCQDIAKKLDTEGHMSFLIRLATGNYTLENSLLLDELDDLNLEQFEALLMPLETALSKYESIQMPDECYDLITNGGRIKMPEKTIDDIDKLYKVYCKNTFIGLGKLSVSEFGNIIIKIEKKLTI